MTNPPTPFHRWVEKHIRSGHKVTGYWRVAAGCKQAAADWKLRNALPIVPAPTHRQAVKLPSRPIVPPPAHRNRRDAWGRPA